MSSAASSPALAATYAAIHDSLAGRRRAVDVVTVAGPEARSYLEGQCSQQLAGLAPGESAESLVLSPQGKLDAYVRVYCVGDEELLVVVAEGFGEGLFERLRRFKLRVKAELALARLPLVELRGPQAAAPPGARPLLVDWPGYVGVDLLGSDELPAGLEEGDEAAFEAARIEAGMPEMGRELDERTIPPEAGIVARTVSFTKGCFTGQELVARLDARGNRVPRHLRGVLLPADAEASPASPLYLEERVVGELTSVAFSPAAGRPVALGYVRREVEAPAELALGSPGGPPALVRQLPLAG